MTMRTIDRLVAEFHTACKVFETYTFIEVIDGDHQYDIEETKADFVVKCMETKKIKSEKEARHLFYEILKQHCKKEVVLNEWDGSDNDDSF
jgi:hypothetical protein